MQRANPPQFFKQHSQSLEEQELIKPTMGVANIDNIIGNTNIYENFN